MIKDYCNVKFAIASNSATSSLHSACYALGVREGDVVWTAANTFVASSNSAIYCGANVDFIDIDPDTYNICLHDLERKLRAAKENNNLLIHADNFTNADLKKFHEFHINFTIPSGNLITMMTFRSNNPEKCGIVEIDENGQVKNFYEKDRNFHGNIANAAIYFFKYDLIEILLKNKTKFSDFSLDVIPLLIGKINTYHIHQELIDIGTKENLDLARKIYKSL